MITGTDTVLVGSKIEDIEVVNTVTLLGIELDRKLEGLERNWEKCISKIIRLSNFWRLQRLGIAGRVLVAKTYLLSQVTYMLGTLSISQEVGDRINEILVQYVKGTDRPIARDRWFLPAYLGGYGLIDVNILSSMIKASWIKRWLTETENNPDYLSEKALRGCRIADNIGIYADAVRNPCLYNVLNEWWKYKTKYYKVGENALKARLFENNGLGLEGGKIEE